MANYTKSAFLLDLQNRYGKIEKFGDSLSLYKVVGSDIRIYIRYSKLHSGGRTWYGLREKNLQQFAAPDLRTRFSTVANSERRSLFTRQLIRPTFKMSGLGELCTFLEYSDVYNWHQRVAGKANGD